MAESGRRSRRPSRPRATVREFGVSREVPASQGGIARVIESIDGLPSGGAGNSDAIRQRGSPEPSLRTPMAQHTAAAAALREGSRKATVVDPATIETWPPSKCTMPWQSGRSRQPSPVSGSVFGILLGLVYEYSSRAQSANRDILSISSGHVQPKMKRKWLDFRRMNSPRCARPHRRVPKRQNGVSLTAATFG
jgi:hypothetical protein